MAHEINQSILKSFFDYKDGFLYWKISLNKKIRIGDKAGCLDNSRNGTPRYIIVINKKHYLSARLIFLYHHGYLPKFVDHIDRNPENDRIENLRPATKSQNATNSKTRKNSASIYKGVGFRRNNKWCASIVINGHKKWLGTFDNESDAALAYNKSAVINHKEFANLNIIQL